MKITLAALALPLLLGAVACQSDGSSPDGPGAFAASDDDDDEDEDDDIEEAVALSQVPQVVKDAALAAVPGLVLASAEKETESSGVVYCLHGTADGMPYEVEITPSGVVQEIESGDDEDDDDDDDEG